MLAQVKYGNESYEPHAARAGRALFFALLGVFLLPGIASALVALGLALALIAASRLVRSLVGGAGRAMRSGGRAAGGAASPPAPPLRHAHRSLEDAPPVALVGEAEVEGGVG